MLRQHSLRQQVGASLLARTSSTSACASASSSLHTLSSPVAASASASSSSHLLSASRSSSYFLSHRTFAVKAAGGGDKKGGAKGGAKGNAKDDAAKKKKKKKATGKPDQSGGLAMRSADLSQLETLLEAQLTAPEYVEKRTPAELALDNEYAKEYSRRCMSAHKQYRARQVAFLKSRWQAVNALPTSLRNEALKEDMSPWPKNYQPIPWTPQEYIARFGPAGSTTATPAKK